MKKRKSGNYWVKYNNEFYIAWYDADLQHPFKSDIIGFWHGCCFDKEILEDSDFTYISNKLLKPPKEKKK